VSIATKVKARACARLEELVQCGAVIPLENHRRVVSIRSMTGEKGYKDFQLASFAEFVEWRTSCVAVLDQVVPMNSLLRKTVDEFRTLKNEPGNVVFGCSFLRAVKTELEDGSLDSLVSQIENELLADYLSQAESILAESRGELTHVAAAVLAGASLENFLRSMCQRCAPPESTVGKLGAPLALTALIDALKSRQAFNEVDAKFLRAWAGIRNNAAHGKFEEFNRSQVEQMVRGVLSFVSRHAP